MKTGKMLLSSSQVCVDKYYLWKYKTLFQSQLFMDVQQLLISLILFVWEGFFSPHCSPAYICLWQAFFWFCVLSCFSCRSNLYFFNNTIFLNMTDRVFLSLSTVSSTLRCSQNLSTPVVCAVWIKYPQTSKKHKRFSFYFRWSLYIALVMLQCINFDIFV